LLREKEGTAVIELNNIAAGYGKNIVLKDVSAVFEKGCMTSIIGVNGCGKSTLLKTVLGILPFSGGEIIIDGTKLGDMTRNHTARKIAYLAQGKSTPDMTVGQLVLHGRFPYLSYPRRYGRQDRRIAFSAMEQMGVAELAERPLNELSGGMRQNAYIAMALAQEADYILLDEPATYLDIAHQLDLMKTLKELAGKGKGIVTVMHDLPMALTFSDMVIFLNGGKVECSGSPELVLKSGAIERIFGVEVGLMPDGQNYGYSY
jgi:ABC-type cobalamin/Fe3+-siderophores transport system ATPase subunit